MHFYAFPNYLYKSGKTFVIFKDIQITLLLLLNIYKGYFTRFLLLFATPKTER